MGYYASGYGSVIIRTDYDTPTLHKRYKRKTLDFYDGRKRIEADTLLKLILDHDEGFEDIQISNETDGSATLDLSASEKYHGELVTETLDRLAPITIEGEIRFNGEDDCQWCFHFEGGKFLEYNGDTFFECDNPYCPKKDCIFSDGERCRASLIKSSYDKSRTVEQDHVVSCSNYVRSVRAKPWAKRKRKTSPVVA